MNHTRPEESWKPLLVVGGLAAIGVCLVLSTAGCSGFTNKSDPLAGFSLPKDEGGKTIPLSEVLDSRDFRTRQQIEQIAEDARQSHARVVQEFRAYLDEHGLDDEDLDERLQARLADFERKGDEIITEAELAAKSKQREFSELERRAVEAAAEKTGLEKGLELAASVAPKAAAPASMIPGVGPTLSAILLAIGGVAAGAGPVVVWARSRINGLKQLVADRDPHSEQKA